MKIQFITGNVNKFEEAQTIVSSLEQLDIDLPEIQEIDAKEVIKAKLKEAQKHHKGSFAVEDTSFSMDCISDVNSESNRLPGPLIKWFLQAMGNEGLYELAKKYNNFNAQIKAIIGYAAESGEVTFFEGIVYGQVVAPSGDSGFGLDPIFQPNGYEETFSEMRQEKKNAISHRRIAFEKLRDFLQ